MSTRGIIAYRTQRGWSGRYCHWDNYPSHIVPTLGEIVARDGVLLAIKTLITDTGSWSVINPHTTDTESNAWIEGYGVKHLDTDSNNPSAMYTQDDTDFSWCEWLYIIHKDHLEVRKIYADNEPTTFHSSHSWDSISGVLAQ